MVGNEPGNRNSRKGENNSMGKIFSDQPSIALFKDANHDRQYEQK